MVELLFEQFFFLNYLFSFPRWFAPFVEIVRCICFLFAEKTLLKIPETELKEFNLELNFVSHLLKLVFAWSAVLWALVFAFRQLDAKFEISVKLTEKLTKLQKKLIKGLYIRIDEKEFKKVN